MTDDIRPNVIAGTIDDLGSAEVTEETVLGRCPIENRDDYEDLIRILADLALSDSPCPDTLGDL